MWRLNISLVRKGQKQKKMILITLFFCWKTLRNKTKTNIYDYMYCKDFYNLVQLYIIPGEVDAVGVEENLDFEDFLNERATDNMTV